MSCRAESLAIPTRYVLYSRPVRTRAATTLHVNRSGIPVQGLSGVATKALVLPRTGEPGLQEAVQIPLRGRDREVLRPDRHDPAAAAP